MNDSDVRELLDRAAEQVGPRMPVTGSVLRARARRRQRVLAAMATAGAVLCVVAAVAVSAADLGAPRSSRVPATPATGSPTAGAAVSLPRKEKSVSMIVPAGWRQQRVDATFNPCTARPNTVYLGGDPIGLITMWKKGGCPNKCLSLGRGSRTFLTDRANPNAQDHGDSGRRVGPCDLHD